MSINNINIINTSTLNMACTEPPVKNKESMFCYMCSDPLPNGEYGLNARCDNCIENTLEKICSVCDTPLPNGKYGPKVRCDDCIENTREEICSMCDTPCTKEYCDACQTIANKEFDQLRMLGEDMETWLKRIGKLYNVCSCYDIYCDHTCGTLVCGCIDVCRCYSY